MAIFGGLKKPSTFGQVPGMGMMQPEVAQPMMQPGMMQAPVQQPAKNPGPNWAGIAADFLAGMAGQPGQFAAQQQHERAMQQRQQMADQERMTRREDMQWEWANKPRESSPYRWESNDGSLLEVGPDGNPRVVYKDPTPKQQWVPDGYGGGQFVPITGAPATGLPEIGAVVPRNKGGAASNGGNGFPYR